MALVIGHSQTKYLSDYLSVVDYNVFSYAGYTTFQFLEEDILFEVSPFYSVIVLVVGANDIGSHTPQQIAETIERLSQKIHAASPSAVVCVSEILPRAQNLFPESQLSNHVLEQWNYDASLTNRLLDSISNRISWMNVIDQRDFHTMFGAIQLISENDIILVPQMGAFMVKGQRGDKYSVVLFPNEKCSCPSTTRCYHIIAAMMAIGMKLPDDKKMYNLTQLRRNCRSKQLKKCGTKKGRVGDNDNDININAAPDSVLKTINRSAPNTPIICENTKLKTPISKVKKILFTSTPKSILKSEVTPKSSTKKRKLKFKDNEHNKVQKLDNSLSVIFEDNDIIEMQQSRNDESFECNIQPWLPELGLNMSDKDLLTNNKKLNSNHMEAVNKLLRQQVGSDIGGLQLTERVPVFNDSQNRWTYKITLNPVQSPSCQIHHTHKDHWIATIFHNNKLHLIDSLGNDRDNDRIIPDGLKIQLSQMFGKNKNDINVYVPSVMKQDNSIDCGLFAIAYITSYCLKRELSHNVIFDPKKLRSHLLQCFETGVMLEFPITDKTISQRRKNIKNIIIKNYCICNLPECLDNMVQCDKCLMWFHKNCINAPSDISSVEKDFSCGLC